MKERNIYNRWIEEGYKYFSDVGPMKFSVKELSKITGLTRTSFNYYFHSKKEFFETLMERHLSIVDEFGQKFYEAKPHSYENLLKYIDEYPVSVSFHLQLFNHRHDEFYNKMYILGHEYNFKNGILDWFLDFFGLKIGKEEAKRIYFFFIDVAYTRGNLLKSKSKNLETIKYSMAVEETTKDFLLIYKSISKNNILL